MNKPLAWLGGGSLARLLFHFFMFHSLFRSLIPIPGALLQFAFPWLWILKSQRMICSAAKFKCNWNGPFLIAKFCATIYIHVIRWEFFWYCLQFSWASALTYFIVVNDGPREHPQESAQMIPITQNTPSDLMNLNGLMYSKYNRLTRSNVKIKLEHANGHCVATQTPPRSHLRRCERNSSAGRACADRRSI